MRSPLWLEILLLDLRYAWRRLAKNPAFTLVACLSLALGIGANTAAFGVLYAVLLRSLPVKDPAALVVVSTRNTASPLEFPVPMPSAGAIGSLLYEVEPGDWKSLAGAVIVLSSVAAAAAWVLARRASRADPLAALRSE